MVKPGKKISLALSYCRSAMGVALVREEMEKRNRISINMSD